MSDAVRAEKIAHEVDDAARQLAQAGRLDLTREFIQHGDVTVYAHVTSVARTSLSFAERLGRVGVSIDRASLLRGALLHDYFLYDWHDPDPSHRLHGFRHPFFALARAEEDFELTSRERNIIVRHMFPLVPVPPTCREAWIVCLADKWCARWRAGGVCLISWSASGPTLPTASMSRLPMPRTQCSNVFPILRLTRWHRRTSVAVPLTRGWPS